MVHELFLRICDRPYVKVFCTHTEPNYSLPWQRKRQARGLLRTSTGPTLNLVLLRACA